MQEGLNIITGKSSTGKSALIEIFDYCFGGGYTVPKGVITQHAEIYYLYLQIQEQYFVLGRKKDNGRGFFRREDAYQFNLISSDYFLEEYFLTNENYKKQLTKLFIDIVDINESQETTEFRGRSLPSPSVRSFMSFILQHQNLVANKHALFYRFDEREKREQAIAHTKIFLGFVDQKYYLLSQEEAQLKSEIKALEKEQKIIEKYINENNISIENQLNVLYSLMGMESHPVKMEDIRRNAQDSKQTLNKVVTDENIIYDSNREAVFFKGLLDKINNDDNKRRKLSFKLESIRKHLDTEKEVSNMLSSMESLNQVQVGVCVCPFCLSENNSLTRQADLLGQAMKKLSQDIALNHSLRSQLEVEEREISQEIRDLDNKIKETRQQKRELEQKNEDVKKIKSRYEQILQIKASLFSMLDILVQKQSGLGNGDEINQLKQRLSSVEASLSKYSFKNDLSKAEERINQIMSEIGKYFDFEDSYKPINLKFSLNSFDLYHDGEKERFIYVQWEVVQIGFIAILLYGFNVAIPSILFLDQPTQVYFPNFQHDNAEIFDTKDIANLEHKENIDGDIKAVTHLFIRLAKYCHDLKEQYGYAPQIIITDHADNLDLGDYEFESFVKSRWRTRGLIDIDE
ncbi:DUF3732 domain-containing protein [Neisseria flavescens]|uniref:DUF3732 domain-containing protein n=1 Tax=Neisseria flavescens TaxID=484 RepID=UPI00352EA26A